MTGPGHSLKIIMKAFLFAFIFILSQESKRITIGCISVAGEERELGYGGGRFAPAPIPLFLYSRPQPEMHPSTRARFTEYVDVVPRSFDVDAETDRLGSPGLADDVGVRPL